MVLFLAVGMPSERAAAGDPRSPVKSDEEIVYYATSAALDPEGWRLPIHGRIFEPERESWKRRQLLRLLRSAVPGELSHQESAMFDRRIRGFLVDDERGKETAVRLGPQVYAAGESGPDGHFRATLRLSAADAEKLLSGENRGNAWLAYRAVLPPGDARQFVGRVQLVGPTGLSVVSDIDDTIKRTEVRDRRAMLANTFLRPFEAVPGMADWYRRLATAGAVFHYVSASPWQLYPALDDFRAVAGFPEGAFHLKSVRLTDSTSLDLFESPEEFKRPVLEELLARYPRRRFLLVGDTGEKDPEIFGRLAREHEEQVAGVFLRNVTGETADNPRMKKALDGIGPTRWVLFADPGEVLERSLKEAR